MKKSTKELNAIRTAVRTDFLSGEEVLQMLAAGKHLGCLSLEKGDNRLDIYLQEGRIYFLDPHHIVRRVVPGDGSRPRWRADTRRQMTLAMAMCAGSSVRRQHMRRRCMPPLEVRGQLFSAEFNSNTSYPIQMGPIQRPRLTH